MDTIYLQGIELWTHIGVPEEERAKAQRLLVDVTLHHSTMPVAQSEDLTHGIDYAAVVTAIQDASQRPRATVERLAEDIAAIIIERWHPSGGVTVTVTKFPALPLTSARITIQRP